MTVNQKLAFVLLGLAVFIWREDEKRKTAAGAAPMGPSVGRYNFNRDPAKRGL